jgi:hypothetical protein
MHTGAKSFCVLVCRVFANIRFALIYCGKLWRNVSGAGKPKQNNSTGLDLGALSTIDFDVVLGFWQLIGSTLWSLIASLTFREIKRDERWRRSV